MYSQRHKYQTYSWVRFDKCLLPGHSQHGRDAGHHPHTLPHRVHPTPKSSSYPDCSRFALSLQTYKENQYMYCLVPVLIRSTGLGDSPTSVSTSVICNFFIAGDCD